MIGIPQIIGILGASVVLLFFAINIFLAIKRQQRTGSKDEKSEKDDKKQAEINLTKGQNQENAPNLYQKNPSVDSATKENNLYDSQNREINSLLHNSKKLLRK